MDDTKIRNVTAPLTMDQIKEFFLDKSLLFVIDLANSKLKGKVFLTYISNLDLPAEVDLTGSSKEDIMGLLKDYMEVRNINECKGLAWLAAMVLLHNRGCDVGDDESPLTSADMTEFAAANPDLMERWYMFLDSMILFSMMSVQVVDEGDDGEEFGIPAFEEAFPGIFDNHDIIDDSLYIGSNIVNIFSIPLFMERYFAVPSTNSPKYFKQQFTEYMFKGKRLFHYFANENNTFFQVLMALVTKKVTVENMVKALHPS